MPDDDKLEIAGSVWDSLSTGKKCALIIMCIATLVAVGGSCFWFARSLGENKLAAQEAKHEREITELQKQLREVPRNEYTLEFVPPDEGLPNLSDAETNKLGMTEFHALHAQFKKETRQKTSIQSPSFFERYASKRFTWIGYVNDVSKDLLKGVPYFCLTIRSNREQPFSDWARCYFDGAIYEEMLKGLSRDQEVTVTGVLNSNGALTKCKFVKIGSPPQPPP